MFERRIIIGLITSTKFLQNIEEVWDSSLLESSIARRVADWVWEYFQKFGKAPGKDMENIYLSKLKDGEIPDQLSDEIESGVLSGLSEESIEEPINVDYLLEQTFRYLNERKLLLHASGIRSLIAEGKLEEANKLACGYSPIESSGETDIDLSNPKVLPRIKKAFDIPKDILVKYPKQLGEFWNHQFIRGGFIAFLAPEKRGKSFWLLDVAVRAYRQKRRVAFFQAGDMTEDQQLRRISIYLTKKSDLAKYSGKQWEVVRDCVYNQLNTCSKKERESDFGVFDGESKHDLKEKTVDDLIEAYKNNPDYKPCYNCPQYESSRWGVPWVKELDMGEPLTAKEAMRSVQKFFVKSGRSFKLSTHPNNTLTVQKIRSILMQWEKRDGFVPDLIVIDYADIMDHPGRLEFRHKQNEIWKGLRSISQEWHCLVVTATQADAGSYRTEILRMSNFSEDKRKLAHVTAMYGLNQDPSDREKKIGLMRINEIAIREGDFTSSNKITILQDLKRGRPFLGSFWSI